VRILVLEDNEPRQKMFKIGLIGHVYTIVDTAEDAIKALQEEMWDAVFLDHDLYQQAYVMSGPGTRSACLIRCTCTATTTRAARRCLRCCRRRSVPKACGSTSRSSSKEGRMTTGTKTETYRACDCGADCGCLGENENEPCWGTVSPVDEWSTEDGDSGWIHACHGHADILTGDGRYKKEP
jgi:hypothetical protein